MANLQPQINRLFFLDTTLIPQTAQTIQRYQNYNNAIQENRNRQIQARVQTLVGGGELEKLPIELRTNIAKRISVPPPTPQQHGLAPFLVTQPVTFYQNNLQNYVNERHQLMQQLGLFNDPNNLNEFM
jgi:hypothetical protein